MNELRRTFLDTAVLARDLVASPEVERRWDEPSALPKFSIRGLAGHLIRATTSVTAYMDRGEPDGPPISTAAYYADAVSVPDLDSELHRAIRQRGEAEAAGGRDQLIARFDEALERLQRELEAQPGSRLMRVYDDMVLTLDDYLVSRIIELVVHLDDLAVSVGRPLPSIPPIAFEIAIRALVDVARLKQGDLAVVRALTRRERDAVEALRVL
ncbi:MAG TPA: maleylpyruvate isomerase N-terminal domain-containing protein [Actinomycetota bacterium]|nr:maleylpyruvate isomerase N-terminal domain-containing protein [Actinomycetota bacterium]